MAVFPDRIVLKNSTDTEADIRTAIGSGGTDDIVQGELVIGIDPTDVALYTLDGNGDVVKITGSSSASGGGRAIVSDNPPTIGIDGAALAEGDLWFESDTGDFYVYYTSASTAIDTFGAATTTTPFTFSQTDLSATISGGTGTGATVDVDTSATGEVTAIRVKAGGSGYTVGDSVTITEAGGTPGIATATVTAIGTSNWVQINGSGAGGTTGDYNGAYWGGGDFDTGASDLDAIDGGLFT